jgi:nucleoside-diphosphate-sugar epimerase
MRVAAVTGAGGFLGEALVNRLHTDFNLRILFRQSTAQSDAWKQQGCRIIIGDLDNDAALAELVEGAEVVYHCAATFAKTTPALSDRVNVRGTENIARVALVGGARRFVYVSSTSVYAATKRSDKTMTEEFEPENINRLNNYSRTKYEGELVVKRLAHEEGLRYTIIRPTNIYGIRSKPWFRQWESLLGKVPIAIGDIPIDLVYIDDVVEAMVMAAESPQAEGEVFNVGHEMVKMSRFIGEIGRVTGHRAWDLPFVVDRGLCFAVDRLFRLFTGTTISPSLIRLVYYPHTKARRLFGYTPRFTITEGLADLARIYRLEKPIAS